MQSLVSILTCEMVAATPLGLELDDDLGRVVEFGVTVWGPAVMMILGADERFESWLEISCVVKRVYY